MEGRRSRGRPSSWTDNGPDKQHWHQELPTKEQLNSEIYDIVWYSTSHKRRHFGKVRYYVSPLMQHVLRSCFKTATYPDTSFCSLSIRNNAKSSLCFSFHVCVSHIGFLHLKFRCSSMACITERSKVSDCPMLCTHTWQHNVRNDLLTSI